MQAITFNSFGGYEESLENILKNNPEKRIKIFEYFLSVLEEDDICSNWQWAINSCINYFDTLQRKKIIESARTKFLTKLYLQKDAESVINFLGNRYCFLNEKTDSLWNIAEDYYSELALKEIQEAQNDSDLPHIEKCVIRRDIIANAIFKKFSQWHGQEVRSVRTFANLKPVYDHWKHLYPFFPTELFEQSAISFPCPNSESDHLVNNVNNFFRQRALDIYNQMSKYPEQYSFSEMIQPLKMYFYGDLDINFGEEAWNTEYLAKLVRKASTYEECSLLVETIGDYEPIMKDAAMKKAQRLLGLSCS